MMCAACCVRDVLMFSVRDCSVILWCCVYVVSGCLCCFIYVILNKYKYKNVHGEVNGRRGIIGGINEKGIKGHSIPPQPPFSSFFFLFTRTERQIIILQK
jgi:hypothetical protein